MRPSFAACVALAASFACAPAASGQEHPIAFRLTRPTEGTVAPGGIAWVQLTATIPPGWHLYSMAQPPGGPIPTSFAAGPAGTFQLGADIEAPVPMFVPDPNFGITSAWHEDSAVFRLPILVASSAHGSQRLITRVTYQTCTMRYCLPPTDDTLAVNIDIAGALVRSSMPAAPTQRSSGSLLLFLWTAATMGLLALLTPCVFPMVPITISFFGQRKAGGGGIGGAALYALGIVGAFTVLGLGLSLVFGVAGVNRFAANPWLNLAIGAVFVLFALSLFGVLEIALPSRMLNALDAGARRSRFGPAGATLLMGGVFALTTFTCTAPFVGTLLVSAASGDWRWPAAGLFVFSGAFALPFFVLALVPDALGRLPRSGQWLATVKGALAFVEIAAAMKFISNADLVQGWSVFTRQVVVGTWVALAALMALYLIGLRVTPARLRVDAPRYPVPATLALALALWLARGLGGARLGELESFLPPAGATQNGVAADELAWIKDDLRGALATAKRDDTRVLIDFTGFTCTNCRWMEANMFPRPGVQGELRHFVRVRLFTDGSGARYQRQQKFELETFQTVALPLYAVVDWSGQPKATFLGMTRDAPEFIKFLADSRKTP